MLWGLINFDGSGITTRHQNEIIRLALVHIDYRIHLKINGQTKLFVLKEKIRQKVS